MRKTHINREIHDINLKYFLFYIFNIFFFQKKKDLRPKNNN